jgi:N-acetylmuramoyl-L-alanine amidase
MSRGSGARWLRLLTATILLAVGLTSGTDATGANDTVRSLAPLLTPFSPDGDRVRDTSGVHLSIGRAASVDVLVLDLHGAVKRSLATDRSLPPGVHRIPWDGRDASGRRVPNAYYRLRVRVTNELGTVERETGVTVANRVIYGRAPGLITIAIDPGHGGWDTGAVVDGTRESDLNLDIALRLAAMLRGAGVRVFLTRDRDVGFNPDSRDRNGDGRVDRADDLQGRLDLVEPVRPDLLLIVMNNASRCHCYRGPGVWLNRSRTFGAANERLGRLLQEEFVRSLRPFETGEWTVRDTGLHESPTHQQMAPFARASRPRPGQAPTVMGESLYLDQPAELALLRRGIVRQAIASAYYEAVARYIASRPAAVAYRLVRTPGRVVTGASGAIEVEVINRGQADLAGAQVTVAIRPDDTWHDAHAAPGRLRASAPLRTLPPAGRQTVRLAFPAPAPGAWRLLVDVVRADGTRLSSVGSPVMRVPFPVDAAGTPKPSSSPSPVGSPSPSPAPSPSPGP